MPALSAPVRALLLLTVLGWAFAAPAAPANETQAQERQRIQAERREANRRFQAAQSDCEQRFAVTTCLEDARSERRRVLDRLAREQAVLDDVQRRQRAAERLRAIQDKARQADEQAGARAPVRRVQRTPALPANAASSPPAVPGTAPADPVAAQRQAERERRDYERRQQEAQAHREAVQQRNAARDAKKAPAAPLPIPSAPGSGKR